MPNVIFHDFAAEYVIASRGKIRETREETPETHKFEEIIMTFGTFVDIYYYGINGINQSVSTII